MRVLHVIIRKHLAHCRDRHKGPYWPKCLCPKWVDGMLGGRRVRKALDVTDWSEAERKVVQIERSHGIFEDKLLVEAIADWEASWRISEASKRKYRQLMKAFKNWAAANDVLLLEDVTLTALDAFYGQREVSALTKIKEIQSLRTFCRFCIDRKWLQSNPALLMRMPRGIKPNEIVPYTREEIGKMLAACARLETGNPTQKEYMQRRARALILLLWQTGLRIGDAYRLRKDAINDGILTIHTQKTAHPIRRRLSAELLTALEALPVPMHDSSGGAYFFWTGKVKEDSRDGGQRRMVIHAIRMLQPVFREAGIAGAHAHRFRHTMATQMLAAGATMADVALALGNTVAICEKVYAKYDNQRQARIDELIEKAQGRGMSLERSADDDYKLLKTHIVSLAEREGFESNGIDSTAPREDVTAKDRRKQ